jgi:hypothetical protein
LEATDGSARSAKSSSSGLRACTPRITWGKRWLTFV